jgi:hypothetical protein
MVGGYGGGGGWGGDDYDDGSCRVSVFHHRCYFGSLGGEIKADPHPPPATGGILRMGPSASNRVRDYRCVVLRVAHTYTYTQRARA